MRGLEADTIGGFNSMIEKQSKEEGEACISTVLFDDRQEVLYDRVPVDKVEPMNDRQYYVRGVYSTSRRTRRSDSPYCKGSQVCQRRGQTGKDFIYYNNRWYGKCQS